MIQKDNSLPPSWSIARLGDISDKIHYGYTAKSSSDSDGVKYLRITDIQDNEVNWEEVPFCKIDEEELKNYKLESGDIVFARSGATVGKTYLLNKSSNVSLSTMAFASAFFSLATSFFSTLGLIP